MKKRMLISALPAFLAALCLCASLTGYAAEPEEAVPLTEYEAEDGETMPQTEYETQTGETKPENRIWPDKTPVVYIGYSADSGTDHAVRPVIEEMAAYLGEAIDCQNMEGNNSADAANYVLSLPHDGYSMTATGSGGCSSWGVKGYSDSTWEDWISLHAFSGDVACSAALAVFDIIIIDANGADNIPPR